MVRRFTIGALALLAIATPVQAKDPRGSLIEKAMGTKGDAAPSCFWEPEGPGCVRKTGYQLYADCRELDAQGDISQDCAQSLGNMMTIFKTGREQQMPALSCVPRDIDPLRMRRMFVIEAERSERILPFSEYDAMRYTLAKAFQCAAKPWQPVN